MYFIVTADGKRSSAANVSDFNVSNQPGGNVKQESPITRSLGYILIFILILILNLNLNLN